MLQRWLFSLDTIHRATTKQEFEAVGQLRYHIYSKELSKQLDNHYTHQRRILDPEDTQSDAYVLYAGTSDAPTGTIRAQTLHLSSISPELHQHFSLSIIEGCCTKPFVEVGRFTIDRTLRGKLVSVALVLELYRQVCARGIELAFAYCAPGLLAAYARLGFQPYGAPLIAGADGIRIPIVCILSDKAHLDSVGSPLRHEVLKFFPKQAKGLERDALHHALFNKQRPGFSEIVSQPSAVRAAMRQDLETLTPIPTLFNAIPKSLLQDLSRHCFVVSVCDGMLVTRAGLSEREVFIIMQGTFQVVLNDQCLATLQAGDVFGEMGLFHRTGHRTASVRSQGGGRLLVMRRKFIEESMRHDAPGTSRLIFNFAQIMAERFSQVQSQR